METEQLITLPKAAEYLGVSLMTIYRLHKRGTIRFHYRHVPRQTLVSLADLNKLRQPQPEPPKTT